MTTSDERSLEDRIDEIESRTAIGELVAGYCEGVDRQNVERFVGLWHDDAAYLIPGGRGNFHGIAQIRESQTVIAKAWKETYHWTTNHTVQFESKDRAVGRSDVFAICKHHNDLISLVGGTYDDRYERRNGVWKFAERTVTRWFVSAGTDIQLLPPF
ncbi:nuclear transport factor 2 family protein [Micromonospora zingiberis]|uniref:Nuclear transport factor 2 family protein n=1 Tax=Micromonospora zingiberis TaxID=2053011 RepID=A0A4R0GLF2_9ACTN|nr:nuclear transport factor 2 family protein [Micromonospora zingiberis]TCB97213.1 nuclear transport factor 2 family protein [Micromonospora zingiberis]